MRVWNGKLLGRPHPRMVSGGITQLYTRALGSAGAVPIVVPPVPPVVPPLVPIAGQAPISPIAAAGFGVFAGAGGKKKPRRLPPISQPTPFDPATPTLAAVEFLANRYVLGPSLEKAEGFLSLQAKRTPQQIRNDADDEWLLGLFN